MCIRDRTGNGNYTYGGSIGAITQHSGETGNTTPTLSLIHIYHRGDLVVDSAEKKKQFKKINDEHKKKKEQEAKKY